MCYIREQLVHICTQASVEFITKTELFQNIRLSICRFSCYNINNVNQHVLIVKLIDDRLRHYIHLCLQSPFIFNQMMDKQMGDKSGLSATRVANFLIPLPPLAEQQRIVERLDAILPLCDELN